jgi:PAS domain S-box-containing protein
MIRVMSAEAQGATRKGEPLDLRTVIDTIPALVVSALPDGSVEFVNQAWREYTGSPLEELTGWGWQTVMHPGDVSKFVDEWNVARAAGKPFENEARVKRADGQYHWFLIRKVPLRDQADQIVRWYGTGYDIEDRKQTENGLRLVLDATPALIHTGRPDGYLDYFNQRWLEYSGLSLEDVCGWRWTNAIHPEDVEGVLQKWRAALASGESFETEARVRRADGEYRCMLHRSVPLRDEQGKITKWHGSSIDIEERRRAEKALRVSESYLVHAQQLTKAGSWAYKPPDVCEYWSEEMFRMFGFDASKGYPPNDQVSSLIHPEDRERAEEALTQHFKHGRVFDMKYRIIRSDGQLRVIRDFGTPIFENGVVTRFVGACLDVTEQEQRIDELRRSEFYLAEGQRLAHMGSWAFNPAGFFDHWSRELFQIYGLDPAKGAPTLEGYLGTIHPQDRDCMAETIKQMHQEGSGCDIKKRIVRPDGEVRYVRCVGIPVLNNGFLKGFLGTAMDVTEQEHLTQQLRRREAYLMEAQELSHTGSFGWNVASGEISWSDETFRIYEYEPKTKPTLELVLDQVHPEDRSLVQQIIDRAYHNGTNFDVEYRLLMQDGRVKHLHVVAHAFSSSSGNLEFVGAVTDITATKQAEEKIREQEVELRQVLDLTPQHVAVLGADGSRLYLNQAGLDYFGLTLEEWRPDELPPAEEWRINGFPLKMVHPDDRERVTREVKNKLSSGLPHEIEARLLRKDGKYRWFLSRQNPLRDGQGHIKRWYSCSTDIEDRKRAEELLQQENVALREEIDKASMFEEIVGTSPALQSVLSRISKVAPTDSTVLVTGETGTGKELVARAIHRRSRRSSRAFVSVNCAAIPRDLIGSELFGHEKGAFTGATQRRLGRFELAEGGTIFLDEVGELPAETQIALLRVLQEREFERVGGAGSIRTDVRVIAATNRDLQAAIAAGAFRRDLFYRLNVFPIEIPALRERREDIPLLVEYFIDRYARKAGKAIREVKKNTVNLLQSYPWPGNIRELQNVIERSVIVCETETFSVDESWLSRQPLATDPKSQFGISEKLAAQEKEIIEDALRESGGQVFGPSGAAAKLGMPRSTLESKIRSLKINKNRFKTADPSKSS